MPTNLTAKNLIAEAIGELKALEEYINQPFELDSLKVVITFEAIMHKLKIAESYIGWIEYVEK